MNINIQLRFENHSIQHNDLDLCMGKALIMYRVCLPSIMPISEVSIDIIQRYNYFNSYNKPQTSMLYTHQVGVDDKEINYLKLVDYEMYDLYFNHWRFLDSEIIPNRNVWCTCQNSKN